MLTNEPDTGERIDLAFPLGDHGEVLSTGLSKRELFAALAMTGLLASQRDNHSLSAPRLVKAATEHADLLITALHETQN